MRLEFLAPDALDRYGDLFRCDFRQPSDTLIQQAASGTRQTPVIAVTWTQKTPILVSGFRRLIAAETAGCSTLPVLIHDLIPARAKLSEKMLRKARIETWSIALGAIHPADHSSHEIAAAVGRAARDLHRPVHHVLNMSSLPADTMDRKAIAAASVLPQVFLKRMWRDRVDIRRTALMAPYPPRERRCLYLLTCRITRMSLSRLRRFLELLDILSLRESMSRLDVLKAIEERLRRYADGTGEAAPADPRSLDAHILDEMHRVRSPESTRMAMLFSRLKQSLDLPDNVDVKPPPEFEGDSVTVTITAQSTDALHSALEHLDGHRGVWEQIFNLVRGIDDTFPSDSS